MKKSLVVLGAGILLSLSSFAETTEPAATATPAAEAAAPAAPSMTDVGYSFGQTFGVRLKETMPDLDIKNFMEGMSDVYEGRPSRLSEEQMSTIMQQYQVSMQQKQREMMDKLAAENSEKGKAYLQENSKKAGVITTASGLQYSVLQKGTGDNPKLDDVVEVHYTGSLLSGEVFDSSVVRGQSVSFPVNGVIKGWVEALQLMKPGDKWQLTIPSELAYGPAGTPNGHIGPNETLLFDVELLDIKKK